MPRIDITHAYIYIYIDIAHAALGAGARVQPEVGNEYHVTRLEIASKSINICDSFRALVSGQPTELGREKREREYYTTKLFTWLETGGRNDIAVCLE